MPMAARGRCNAALVLKVPRAAKGYADGFYCDLPSNHKSRLHQTSHQGSSTPAGLPYGGKQAATVTATIKWSADASV